MAAKLNLNSILNYAKTYNEVADYVGIQQPAINNGEIAGKWAKIVFTGDGDIITHGRNYTPMFTGGVKGLVPTVEAANGYVAGGRLHFLGNDGKWKQIENTELPIAPNYSVGKDETEGSKYIYNAHQVYQHFHEQIAAVDAMKFKGAFNPNNTEGFPVDGKCEKGDTYRVTENGTYAGYHVSAGDLLICIKEAENVTAGDVNSFDGPEGEAVGEYWMVVEANINGEKQHKVNGVGYRVYTPDIAQNPFQIYAPTTGGTAGQVLLSNGDAAPSWANAADVDLLSNDLKGKLLAGTTKDNADGVTITEAGTFEFKAYNGDVLYTYNTSIETDDWNINIKGKSAGTKNSLTVGEGLRFDGENITSFNGANDRKILLTPASKTLLGGVKIDSRTASTNHKGEPYTFQWGQSTMSVDTNGMIYLTYENICNALGFEPGDVTAVHAYDIILGDSSDDKATPDGLNAEDPFFTLVSTDAKTGEKTIASQIRFIGNSALKAYGRMVDSALSISLDLQTATDGHLGGIKVAKNHTNDLLGTPQVTTAEYLENKLYGVELDKNGKAFVYVPWEDTGKAFSTITVLGGGIDGDAEATGIPGSIKADAVESTFSLIAGNGINLVASEKDKTITINQNVWKTVSPTKMGYVPKMVGTTTKMTQDYYILSYTGEEKTPSWNLLPSGAFKDTWRDIKVNGVAFLDNDAIDERGNVVGKTLNITAEGTYNHTKLEAREDGTLDISSTWRPFVVGGGFNNEGVETGTKIDDNYEIRFAESNDLVVAQNMDADHSVHSVSFEISWYNISEGVRETAY